MSKVLVPVLIGAALIGAAVLTGGVSLIPSLSVTTFGATVTAAGGLSFAAGALGSLASGLLIAGGTSILQGVGSLLKGTPKAGTAQLQRLTPSLVTNAPRKFVFGHTAMAADVRYEEFWGINQERADYVICVASHAVESIDELWFEGRIAWTSGGGVDSFYSGYLTVTAIVEGTAANAAAVGAGGVWDASCRLTGCAYLRLSIKRSGPNATTASPLQGGLPGQIRIIGKGARLYDPRRDSTVAGGSGSHRANDQTTWQFTDGSTDLGGNHALQELWLELGWRINGLLAVGIGLPVSRLDLASYIAGANLCDEAVALAAGGTQRRYEGGGVFSEDQPRAFVRETISTAMNAEMNDSSGRLGIIVAHNDLGGSIFAFTDSDVLGDFAWDPVPATHETPNIVRGQYVDATANGGYQLRDYPEVAIASPDGIDRTAPLDLPMTQDPNRAQRLAKQKLERAQIGGVFTAEFGRRALAVKRGQPVTVTFGARNFTTKLFRVMGQRIIPGSGRVQLVLREEADAIYAWDRDEAPAVVASSPALFDRRNSPLAIGVAAAALTADWSGVVDDGAKPADNATDNSIYVGSSPPGSPNVGKLWKDTSGTNPVLKLWSGAAWERLAGDSVASIGASANHSSISGSAFLSSQPGTITTGSVTASGSGGSAYSYAWGLYSGDAVTINSPTSATTTVSRSCHFSDDFAGVLVCTVTETTTGQTATVFVDFTITETH